jgi:hypothetical protein
LKKKYLNYTKEFKKLTIKRTGIKIQIQKKIIFNGMVKLKGKINLAKGPKQSKE